MKEPRAETIHPENLRFIMLSEDVVLIDVSSESEFEAIHVPGSINLPMGSSALEEYMTDDSDGPTFVICRGGVRSARVCAQYPNRNLVSVRGGSRLWKRRGFPVHETRVPMSIERQVRIAAGSLVALGTLGGIVLHSAFLAVPLLVGCGLAFAGATDTCAMGVLLSKMPWNKTPPTPAGEAQA